ncbi:MAG: mitochondrial fission ELM1 family protein [Pseudomonadales bacterium]|nr:mitochondrial fission ELM1 family protein [Pseudomonadales bacterium]
MSDPRRSRAYRAWALIGPKQGDNAQVRALAAALAERGVVVDERVLAYRSGELLVHALPVPVLAGARSGTRAALAPPWPDLVIGAGRRSEPVARWIRRASAGRARLVHLGRPWARPTAFDLVVASSQYDVPPSRGVMTCVLPLTGPVPALPVGPPADGWGFARLPRPWTGVLVGGNSGYLRFDRDRAVDLARSLNAACAPGGSLLVTGSPRTPPPFLAMLEAALVVPHHVHAWSPQAANPYHTILRAADVVVVTSDSVSMAVEAVAAGRPVYLYDVTPRGRGWWRHAGEYRWRALSHRLVQAWAPRRFRRDVRRIHEALVAAGALRWLDGPAVPFVPAPIDPARDLVRVRDRVLALLDSADPGPGAPGSG